MKILKRKSEISILAEILNENDVEESNVEVNIYLNHRAVFITCKGEIVKLSLEQYCY